MTRRSLYSAWWLISAPLVFFTLWGCSDPAITSRRVLPDSKLSANYDDHGKGLAYFLPLGKIHIVAQRLDTVVTNFGIEIETLPNGAKVRTFATQVLTDTNTIITTWTTNFYASQQLLASLTSSNIASTTSNVLAFGQTLNTSTSSMIQTTKNGGSLTSTISSSQVVSTTITNPMLPAAQVNQNTTITAFGIPVTNYLAWAASTNDIKTIVTTEQPEFVTNHSYTVTITTDYVGDPTNLFLLRPHLDAFHDDNINLTVDGNGLLSTLATTNTDQTGAVVETLAQTAIQTFQVIASGGIGAVAGGGTRTAIFTSSKESNDFALVQSTDDVRWDKVGSRLAILNRELPLGLPKESVDALRWSRGEIEPVKDALNLIIRNAAPLDRDYFRNYGVYLGPETERLGDALAKFSSKKDYWLLVRLYNRRVLEDTFPGRIARYRSPLKFQTQVPPLLIDISFDPFDSNEFAAAQDELSAGGLQIINSEVFTSPAVSYANVNSGSRTSKTDGVYYRPPMPFEVRIADSQSNVVARSVLLPNRSPTLRIDFWKRSFVSAVSQVTMSNGFVTSYGINKPSSALAIAQVPLTIVNDITAGITNFVQLKFNIATGRNALNSARLTSQQDQMASISNSMAILSLQQQLNQALAAAKTNSPPK